MLNPDAFAEPIMAAEAEYLGSTYPDKIIGIGSTLTLWKRLKIDGLGEFQRGGSNINYIGYQNALRGMWRDCIPIQRKLAAAAMGDASAISDVTARDRGRCAIDALKRNSNYWIEPTDFFKLRYVAATYTLPSRWIPGARTASFTIVRPKSLHVHRLHRPRRGVGGPGRRHVRAPRVLPAAGAAFVHGVLPPELLTMIPTDESA